MDSSSHSFSLRKIKFVHTFDKVTAIVIKAESKTKERGVEDYNSYQINLIEIVRGPNCFTFLELTIMDFQHYYFYCVTKYSTCDIVKRSKNLSSLWIFRRVVNRIQIVILSLVLFTTIPFIVLYTKQ